MAYYLAVDIGASGGRHILGSVDTDGRIRLEEVYRFDNRLINRHGTLCWDVESLFREILEGMKRCRQLGKIPLSMGVDTWAVDFVLLDGLNRPVGETVGYRDKRTEGMDERVYALIPEETLYARTGIQKQIFNTIYQLMAVKETHPGEMEQAQTLLMLPDYFHFLLTGRKLSEYTNATSTQLVDPRTCDWDRALIHTLGYKEELFLPLQMPGTVVGELLPSVAQEVGFSCTVLLPATHDTASAVMAMPSDNGIYISSGTWSLMGVETPRAICTPEARAANFTNEGGYDHRFRFLKNIMGLWMIQNVRHELGDAYSFSQLCEMAGATPFPSRVDVNDARFLAPDNMIAAIQQVCRETGQPVPQSPSELAAVVYESLALSYARALAELEQITGAVYPCIHMLGGGAKAGYLNQLTANATRRQVMAGPEEATATGNLMAQMIHYGEFAGLEDARKRIRQSLTLKTYTPQTP